MAPLGAPKCNHDSWATVRELDQIYGFDFVRTSLIRHVRTVNAPVEHKPHRPGTLHHAYVVHGKISFGPRFLAGHA